MSTESESEIMFNHNDNNVIADDALIHAASLCEVDAVHSLMGVGANVHADADASLRWASSNGHGHVVELLLAAGADVHADADTALRWASQRGHGHVVEMLLAAGAYKHRAETSENLNQHRVKQRFTVCVIV